MKEYIASLNITGIKPDGEQISITAKIGKPFSVLGNEDIEEWACPVSLDPLFKNLHDAHGCDSFQALCLASKLIFSLLSSFVEKGGQLVNEDGADFPLDAYGFISQRNI